VNQAHLPQPRFVRGTNVLLHHRSDLPGTKGMEIDRILQRNDVQWGFVFQRDCLLSPISYLLPSYSLP
jgi:hypothetical protein